MPKVSVILTSLNHEKYIREAIDSVLGQTFADFELIIWDDASSDESWEVINSYSDQRIKMFRNEVRRRAIYGINNAISEVAAGEYIAIHHSDDVWEIDKLEKQVNFLDSNLGIGAAFSNATAIGEDSQLLTDEKHFYSNVFDKSNRTRHEWLRYFFGSGNALCHPSVLIRRTCFTDCGLYRYGLAQLTDFDMWVRLCLKYEIYVFPERLVRFRVRDNEANASGSRPEVRIRDRSEFFYILKQFQKIDSFDELVSIFPEAEKYRRPNGGELGFVLAMVALGENSLPWAKFQAIEMLFELVTNPAKLEKIRALYQFDYQDFIALTGEHDLFSSETIDNQAQEIARRDALISNQAEQINQLKQLAKTVNRVEPGPQSVQRAVPLALPADRSAYERASKFFESGNVLEGKALLEALAERGSTCWDVYNDLAVQYFNDGDYARAEPYFEKGVALEGNTGTTARNFASMRLMAGDVKGALEIWGEILHEQPQDEQVLEFVREVLSNINPIPPGAWRRLVSDIASGRGRNNESETNGGRREIEGKTGGVAVVPEKDIRIFQIYYDENTKLLVDPSFIPLDNTENARPDWCEYWSIRKVLLSQAFDDDTYLGFFSPRFFEKTAMQGSQVLEYVRKASADVISFSPYFDQGALHPSPFYHGESHHPGLLRTAQNVLSMLNVSLDLNTLICDQTTTIFSNYFVARFSFWKKWFAYAEQIFNVCEGPDCELKYSLVNVTQHRNSSDYAMKVFILERLVTIVMEELRIRSEVGIDIQKAPLSFPQSRAILDKLLVCDALKAQFLKTGLPPFVETYVMYRNKLLEAKLT